ncbi:hypothetical protein [Streptomyces venezuelae]|uniref:hypothetical protein n=1 Tax=Streptomyces venezuelae TaxID=54571 RepID=UPI001684A9F8|nr:hypothetical protein [Streptomyces venezuelae]
MATRRLTCYIAVCDLCGMTSDDFEDGVHAASPDEAVQHVTESPFDERGGWTLTPDGVLVCDGRKDAAHEDAHATAGKRMGHDAMRAVFAIPAPEKWPTPERAYAKAPSTISEIGWTARTARTVSDGSFGAEATREFWLRKAALLDRIALADEHVGEPGDATEAAGRAARRLMDVDDAAVICDPRHYVRQQYTRWITHQ